MRSRREVLAALAGGCAMLPRALAAETAPPIRLAISESMLGEVNLNDARVATRFWVKRVSAEVNVVIVDPKLFSTTQEIVERVRNHELDVVALNTLEYRLIANLLDASEIVTATGEDGVEQYQILARRGSPVRRLADLQGRRLAMLKAPKMCLAPAWLETLLDDAHYGPADQFFGAIAEESKFARVVLPVFFGQADACVTSKRGFATMCDLNPQVGRELVALASSPLMLVTFYIFRRNYPKADKLRLEKAISNLRNGAGGQELAALFQFDRLEVLGADSLTSALSLLERADRARARQSAAGKK